MLAWDPNFVSSTTNARTDYYITHSSDQKLSIDEDHSERGRVIVELMWSKSFISFLHCHSVVRSCLLVNIHSREDTEICNLLANYYSVQINIQQLISY